MPRVPAPHLFAGLLSTNQGRAPPGLARFGALGRSRPLLDPLQIPLGDVPQDGLAWLATCPRLAGRLGYPHHPLHAGLGVECLNFLAT